MITKVKKIKNLGIFYDYSAPLSAPVFKRYNLIYGWNGSGKTTFSRLFCALESGGLAQFPELEYKLETSTGITIKHKEAYDDTKIMVFNQDYVRENAPSLDDPYARTRHIYLLGKDDKELARQIETDKAELASLQKQIDPKNKGSYAHRKKELDDTRGTLFKNTADTIAAIKGGTPIRNYNRNNAMKVYGQLSTKEELNEKDLESARKIVDQQLLDDIRPVGVESISFMREGKTEALGYDDFLAKVIKSTVQTLEATVQQVLIDRLKDNDDIADWVGRGLAIHQTHSSKNCEYCGQNIPKIRLDQLAKHFNDAYNQLVSKIDKQIKSLGLVKQRLLSLQPHDKANFYSQYQTRYEKARLVVIGERDKLIAAIEAAVMALEGKKTKTQEQVSLKDKLSTTSLNEQLTAINAVVKEHNDHTKTFKSTVDAARSKLERHYVSLIFDQVKAIDDELLENDTEITKISSRMTELSKKITDDESVIRNSGTACADINKCLEGILGRNELVFEDQKEGYFIKRHGVLAKDLSEGEKTAIAFAYFVIHLNNKDFNLKEGIVIIDDPISSLDVEGIFRVCTLLNTKLKSAKQLIVFTHNFDFFNQIKKWFMNDPDINGVEDETLKQGAFLMIKNQYDNTSKRRTAFLDEIDPLLRDYESEYHYLFKRLHRFRADTALSDQGTIEAVYHYPNIARKVLECFLSFRVPTRGTMYTRMLKMRDFNKSNISITDIKEVYDFINSNSHLDTKTGLIQFDPTLGVNGAKYIDKTLELIKKCDEKHYNSMIKLI